MYFQPQYNNQGKLIGNEALLRWFHPLLGSIYPPLIIELARESGMLLEFEVLAEYVETEKMRRELEAIGCQLIRVIFSAPPFPKNNC